MQSYDKFPTTSDDPELHFYREAAAADPRYPLAAFCYLAKCLKRLLAEQSEDSSCHHHVSGQDVCYAMKDSLLEDFGLLAQDVLQSWNITETNDFGNIVYDLIDVKLLSSSPKDSRADFVDVFQFNDVLNPPPLGHTSHPKKWEDLEKQW